MSRYSPKQKRHATKQYKQRKRSVHSGRLAMMMVVLVALLLPVFYGVFLLGGAAHRFVDYTFFKDDVFVQGVRVDGISLAGFSVEDARKKLVSLTDKRLDQMKIVLTHEKNVWQISPAKIGVSYDVDGALQSAYAVGHTGSETQKQESIQRAKNEGADFKIPLKINETALMEELQTIKKTVDIGFEEAGIVFTPYAEQKFVFTQGKEGYALDVVALRNDIVGQLTDNGSASVALTLKLMTPRFTVDELQTATKKIATFSTSLATSLKERVVNIEQALKTINGAVVLPGEEFSFNDVVGKRTAERGYVLAPVIAVNKSLEPGLGGGICQLSTTMYNALLQADLQVTARGHHSFPSSYAEKGLDAMVDYGSQDLIFTNNRAYPIYIAGRVIKNDAGKAQKVEIIIYGAPPSHGYTVKMESRVLETVPKPVPLIVSDTNAKYVVYQGEQKEVVASREGYTVEVHKVLLDDAGKEVQRIVLYRDVYKPITGQVFMGITPPLSVMPSFTPSFTPQP